MSRIVSNCGGLQPGSVPSSKVRSSLPPVPLNRVPKTWFRCPRKARDFIVNRFMAFKLPCDKRYNHIDADRLFYPSMLIKAVECRKKTLGLWIDLTGKGNFYDHQAIRKKGIECVSLPCGDAHGPPTLTNVRLFFQYVNMMINKCPDGIVGVHCLHGFNRSGFLIVSYLVEMLEFSVSAALATFAKAHPPGIYKQSFIQELFFRYDSVVRVPSPLPLPPWHFKSDSVHRSDYMSHLQDASISLKRPRNSAMSDADSLNFPEEQQAKRFKRSTVEGSIPFRDDFQGLTPISDPALLYELQQLCQSMCKWKRLDFPGVQPLPMDQDHFQQLQSKPYCVTWLAVGCRFMMLIRDAGQVYVFDRSFRCYRVKGLTFPLRKNPERHLTNTLLDGQMVIDKVDGELFPRFLIFDIITVNGQSVHRQPFLPVRYECIRREIIEPRNEAIKLGVINKSVEPFSVRQKTFHDLSHCRSLLSPSLAKRFGHESSGLIFQSVKDPYSPGYTSVCLKWQPPSKMSLDFRLQVVSEGNADPSKKEGLLWVEGFNSHVAKVSSVTTIQDFHYKIVECVYKDGQWIAVKERKDKTSPNTYETYLAFCASFRNSVDSGDLCKLVG